MEDLDFSNPGGPPKPAPQPQVPVYVSAIAVVERVGRAACSANRTVFLNLVKSEPMSGISLLSSMAERVRNTAAGVN